MLSQKKHLCEMKMKSSHILFSILILGITSLILVGIHSFSPPNFFVKTKIEKSIDIDESYSEKHFSNSGSDNGGKTAILFSSKVLKIPFCNTITPYPNLSKKLSPKTHLFLLYCCLKLDC